MKGLIWTVFVLVFALCSADDDNNQSSRGFASAYEEPRDEQLETKVDSLEQEIKRLKDILKQLVPADIKGNLNELMVPRSIEDDVLQNQEDIIDLRVTDSHHDVLISQALSDNKIMNLTFTHEFEVLRTDIDTHNEFLDQTRPPIGSIIAWLPGFSLEKDIPSGWQRCDGSLIKAGPMKGKATPDLNTSGRFLRGGTDAVAAAVQEDAVQDHTHIDAGHTHQDLGHTHSDSGHQHYMDNHQDGHHWAPFIGSDEEHSDDILCSHNYHEKCGGYYLRAGDNWKTESKQAQISTNEANIKTSNSGISGMGSGRVADETRPKNMNVVYIIRVL